MRPPTWPYSATTSAAVHLPCLPFWVLGLSCVCVASACRSRHLPHAGGCHGPLRGSVVRSRGCQVACSRHQAALQPDHQLVHQPSSAATARPVRRTPPASTSGPSAPPPARPSVGLSSFAAPSVGARAPRCVRHGPRRPRLPRLLPCGLAAGSPRPRRGLSAASPRAPCGLAVCLWGASPAASPWAPRGLALGSCGLAVGFLRPRRGLAPFFSSLLLRWLCTNSARS